MRPWMVYSIVAGLVLIVGLASWQVGQAPSQPAPEAAGTPAVAITPRLPGNATTRSTPTAAPTLAATADLSQLDALLPAPTWAPLAPDAAEPLPPVVFAKQGQIWLSDGGDDPPRQLTEFGEGVTPAHPSFSPDGQQVAFVALVASTVTDTIELPASTLFIMDRDGSELREVWSPPGTVLWLPSWTPDGSAIYLLANHIAADIADNLGAEALQVVRFDLAAATETVVVTRGLDPTISRDGARMAYLRYDEDGVVMHLEVAAPDGSGAQRVIDGLPFMGFFAPRFTPDGQRIVVAAIDGPETDDEGYPIVSSKRSPLDALWALLEPPAAEAHGAPWDLWIVNVDGTGLRRLTRLYEDMPMAAFSPDGTEMVVMAYNGFYRMRVDGNELRRIAPEGDHGGIDWAR